MLQRGLFKVFNQKPKQHSVIVLISLLCDPTAGTSERKRRPTLTCGSECTAAPSWEACSVRSAGSTTSGPQMSPWPTKWRPEGSLGKNIDTSPCVEVKSQKKRSVLRKNFSLPHLGVRTSRVHISQSTMECLHGEFDVEPGNGGDRCDYLRERGIDTYLVVVPKGPVGKNGINSVVRRTCHTHKHVFDMLQYSKRKPVTKFYT